MTGRPFEEEPVVFACEGEELIGVIARPAQPAARGVLIIVGGPQYRVGSHRQFVLLARHLALHGVAAMRFDVRGMGDSSGAVRSFEHVGDDIAAAVDCFCAHVPQVREVVLWGLCDAASAALFYAHSDERVRGLVLLNPWVRTAAGEAKAYLRHYYVQRLFSAEFWRRVLHGRFALHRSVKEMLGNVRRAFGGAARGARAQVVSDPENSLPDRMADGLARFDGKVLLVLSGNDLTAKEFVDVTGASPRWRTLLAHERVTRRTLDEANHTFSRQAWRDRVAEWTLDWMKSW